MIFVIMEEIGRVIPVIDEGDPSPSDADYAEAERLQTAIVVKDPRVGLEIMPGDRSARVFWRESRRTDDDGGAR